MNKRDQINFRLDPELSRVLQAKCEELGMTKTEFAKIALKMALDQPEELPTSRPLRGALGSIEERFAKIEQQMSQFEKRLGEYQA